MSASHRSLAVLLVALVAITGLSVGSGSAAPVPGEAGTNTALAPTDSAVTVSGRGPFASMRFTVNQTSNLINQAVSVTWTGGTPTRQGPGNWGAHFVQIFQCWGDDDGSVPGNPGPPPEQCQQGAIAGRPDFSTASVYPNGWTLYRLVTRSGFPNAETILADGDGVLDSVSGNIWRPFRAPDGTVVNTPVDSSCNVAVQGCTYWLNPYFDITTTNEIGAARTGADGTGSELFQVVTGQESAGLGCGRKIQKLLDGTTKVPRCWLVIVPRGEPKDENAGMATFEDEATSFGVWSSPLSPAAWANRIAVPLEFRPVDTGCTLAAQERRIVGTEFVQSALTSWQPTLCGEKGLPPFNFAPIGDASARQQLAVSAPGGPGMAVVGRPLSATAQDPKSPAVYAPVAVSGLVVAFNVERIPTIEAPPEQQALIGQRVERINLTPRILAKLLTQSYRSQVAVGNGDPGYTWVTDNPTSLLGDPDFLRFNPEFELLTTRDARLMGGLVVPSGNFDVAQQMWEYVLADPETRSWLGGAPDEWGMKVNPIYSTDATLNPNGAPFGTPVPTSFPKADPYCYQGPAQSPAPGLPATIVPPVLCGTDWMPYVLRFADGAQNARSGLDTARISLNPVAQTPAQVWRTEPPTASGNRTFLTLTDTASAARLGLQTARLSRAGDGGAERSFIAVTGESLTAGVAAMSPKSEPTVLEPDPTADAPNAYPLTTISYAVVKPLSLDAAARTDFAAFVEFATGAGQTPGVQAGQLPKGYVSLPSSLAQQATTAAERIRTLTAPVASAGPAPTVADAASGAGAAVDAATNPGVTPGGFSPSRPSNSSGSGSRPSSGPSAVATPSSEVPDTSVPASDPPGTTAVETAETVPGTSVAPQIPLTPGSSLGRSRYVVVALAVLALLAAWGALEITKRARRSVPRDEDQGEIDLLEPEHEFADDAPVELRIDA